MDRLSRLLEGDGTVMTAWTSVQDTLYLNTLAATVFDAITLDMQHGMQTDDSVIRGISAIAPTGKPVIVRIPVGRFDFASKALDAGAHAIIAPMINSVEDARQLVSFTKYIPMGDRSYGPTQAVRTLGTDPKSYVKSANHETRVFAMIETRQAVDNMEEIAALDGIDGVFCGPADLSISITGNIVPDPYGDSTIDIVKRMADVARENGKIAASFCGNVEAVETCHALGYRVMALGFDLSYLQHGADRMLGELSFR